MILISNQEITEGPENALIYKELLEFATKIIEALPPQRLAVYKLYKQEGMSIKEIAEKLKISTRTTENHLARAVRYLKNELQRVSIFTL